MKLNRLAATAGLLLAAGVATVAVAGPATAYPANVQGEASIATTSFAAGGTVSIALTHTTPGNATMQIFSAPVVIGGGVVGADGTGVVTGKIPSGYSGAHTLQVIGAGGEIYSFAVTIGSGSTSTGSGSTSGGGLANTGAAVTGIGILGGVLVAGGVFFVVAGRRRTASQTPSV